MKISLTADLPTVQGSLLTQAAAQSERILELIKQSAEEISSVNTNIKHELANMDPQRARLALDKTEIATGKLQEASEILTGVNHALQSEVRGRKMVDHQLAAAVEQEEDSRNAALHDNLTGLPNRVLFHDRLEHGIAQAKRHSWILALMFVDLDDFKGINDTYGHQAGDAVLQTVAMRLKHNTRDEDTVGRLGGDEFLYVLNQPHEQKDIAMVAAKILKAIQAPCKVSVGDVIVDTCIKASIGISVYPKDGATMDALIKRADEAMYEAKENKVGIAFAQ